MDERLLSEFLAEAEELLEELYADVSALRSRRADGRERRELVGRLFRRVHTFKGTASAAGLDAAGALAHEFETLLDAARLGRAALDEPVLDAFEDSVTALSEQLAAAARGESRPAHDSLVSRLRVLAHESAAMTEDDDDAAARLLPGNVAWELTSYERRRLCEAVREGARAYVVRADFGLADFDEQFRRLSEALGASGEVVATQPGVDANAPDRVTFRIVLASAAGLEKLSEVIEPFGATLTGGDNDLGDSRDADEDFADDEHELSRQRSDAAATPYTARAVAPAAYVRAPLEELDEIVSAAHELFVETMAALGESRAADDARAERIRRDFLALEERLIALRMVRVGPTLERAARAGRAAARTSGKLVEFEVAGGDVRLDRTLAARIADPLVHLVRNAVDHGIETEGERLSSGKAARGLVRVAASSEGGRVSLRVEDDGRGVDARRVARAAAERGLIRKGAAVSERQALRLIFRPGFSTAADVSLVSGRGVGLEVVEREVEEAGGEVRVSTRGGRGTSFELRLPTTLALLPALLLRSAGQLYCVGDAQVVESGRARREDLTDEGARILVGGRELPLLDARALLGQPHSHVESHAESDLEFVVVRARGRRVGEEAEGEAAVVFDGVEGRAEVLVRGLGRHATRWRGVSGATELRDGTVALVIDLPRLVEAHAG